MASIIAVVNQKGGVGKTTTAVNLGSYLAAHGKFVLLVDLDPQANATSGLGIDHRALERGVYESVIGSSKFRDIVVESQVEGLRVAPATAALAGAAVELVDMERREYRLSEAIMEVRNGYDYIIIDCPPSLGLLTINGLVAAERVLIPVQAEYYALEGLSQLLGTIELVKGSLRPDLEVMGAVLTMFDGRNSLAHQVEDEVREHFSDKVFKTVIPRNVRLSEAPSHGMPVLLYDVASRGCQGYLAMAEEMLREPTNPVVAAA